jgi:hypothetical protein
LVSGIKKKVGVILCVEIWEVAVHQGGGISQFQEIYNQLLQAGLNSNIKGIRAKAEQGTGNYSFKDAQAVPFDEAITMKSVTMKALTRGENTLIDGELPNGKHVYFAGKTESPQIQALVEKRKSKTDTTSNVPDNKRTTSTYDAWLKRNRRNFDSWYYGNR